MNRFTDKDFRREYARQWRLNNPDKIKLIRIRSNAKTAEYRRTYYADRRDKYNEYHRLYRNKDEWKEYKKIYNKLWYSKNKEYLRDYRLKNKIKINERQRARYLKNKIEKIYNNMLQI